MMYVGDHSIMWMEVVHEGNVDNDVWMTFDTHPLISAQKQLQLETFKVDLPYTNRPLTTFLFGYIPRVIRVFFVHVRHKIFGHDWWK